MLPTSPFPSPPSSHRVQLVSALLAKKADPNAADAGGNGALHVAAQYGMNAVTITLLDGGAKVRRLNKTGASALHLAVRGGHTAVVETLLARKADPTRPDTYGFPPLSIAAMRGEAHGRTQFPRCPHRAPSLAT